MQCHCGQWLPRCAALTIFIERGCQIVVLVHHVCVLCLARLHITSVSRVVLLRDAGARGAQHGRSRVRAHALNMAVNRRIWLCAGLQKQLKNMWNFNRANGR
jgi:hypothetical protein